METLWGFVMGPACHLPSFVTPRCEMLDPFGAGAGPLFGLQYSSSLRVPFPTATLWLAPVSPEAYPQALHDLFAPTAGTATLNRAQTSPPDPEAQGLTSGHPLRLLSPYECPGQI